jgi:hypothetical protein
VVERPWIAIEGTEVLSPLIFMDGRAKFDITFHLKNTGHVPAAHVLILGKFIFRSRDPKEIDAIWTECEQFRTWPLGTRGSGISIFPDQQQVMNYSSVMTHDDVTKLGMGANNGGAATFVGCIDYGWGDNVTRHQTRFVYEIDKRGPNGVVQILPTDEVEIPVADVIVSLNPMLAGNPD